MKINELRIGNYTKDRENRLCRVESVTKDGFRCPATQGGITSLPNEPIPLTEELLVSFGFEKVDKPNQFGWYKQVSNRLLCWCHSDFISLELSDSVDGFNDILFDFDCKYVHQLQNLYFALTSEELMPNSVI